MFEENSRTSLTTDDGGVGRCLLVHRLGHWKGQIILDATADDEGYALSEWLVG